MIHSTSSLLQRSNLDLVTPLESHLLSN